MRIVEGGGWRKETRQLGDGQTLNYWRSLWAEMGNGSGYGRGGGYMGMGGEREVG